MSFADNLRQIRKEKNLSQEELAELLDVSRQAVSKWEQGAGYPEVEKLLAISGKLGVSLDRLMAGEHDMNTIDATEDENIEYAYTSHTAPVPEYSTPVSMNTSTKKKNKTAVSVAAVIIAVLIGIILFFVIRAAVGTGETVTDAEGENIRSGHGYAEMAVRDVDGSIRTIKTDRSLVSPQAILNEYTKVMNNLKDEAPAFTKIRYQNLPTDEQSFGIIGDIVLPIIERFVTSKEASKPVIYPQGSAAKLPVIESPYGCLLTDTDKIKNAYCEVLEDGTYKIVITLIDEVNPEILSPGATSSSSAVSSIFDPYNAINEITSISELALHEISFNYTDCTVTLIYNRKNKEVISVNMMTDIKITAQTLLAPLNAEIVDITEYTDFIY